MRRDVATKIKETATSAMETLTSKQQQTPVKRQDQQRPAPLYRPEGRRPLGIALVVCGDGGSDALS